MKVMKNYYDDMYREILCISKNDNDNFYGDHCIINKFVLDKNLKKDKKLKVIKYFIYNRILNDEEIEYVNKYYKIYKVIFNSIIVGDFINIPKAKKLDFSNLLFNSLDFYNLYYYNVKEINLSCSSGNVVKNLPKTLSVIYLEGAEIKEIEIPEGCKVIK